MRRVIRRSARCLCFAGLSLTPLLAAPQAPLRDLDIEPYRTPRSGEGVRASLFGSPLELPARDRRSVTAWEVGIDSAAGAEDNTALPFGSLYLWRHADDGSLLRASLAGVYDELFLATTRADGGELVLTFENYTLPWATGELVDGEVADAEMLKWGYVRGGLGIGYRTQVSPFEQDNMFASDLIVEPGYSYYGRGDRTAADYVLPDSTFELRLHWQTRLDALQRNLLELPHQGHALGLDVVAGWRQEADAWGLAANGLEPGERHYVDCTAYAFGITAVPGAGDRHRLFASVHAGVGSDLDRFSAQRVGGGPDLRGEEFATTARPWLPGAAYSEFFPQHYLIGSCGYRLELAFFAYLDAGATVAWLDRDRLRAGAVDRQDDTLTALSLRLSTGFVGSTRLQLGYGHGFDVVRDGDRGGDEFVLSITGRF